MSNSKTNAKKICYCAVFSAFICVCTFISVPLPFGYFNLGDIMLLVCSWTMGPVCGAICAAAGSGLADLLMGYTVYVPATIVIKSVMAVTAYYVWTLKKMSKKRNDLLWHTASAFAAETVMVAGYFAYEYVFLYGIGAVASIPGNILQGVCAAVIGALLMRVVDGRVLNKK